MALLEAGQTPGMMDKILGYGQNGANGGVYQNSGFLSPALSAVGTGLNAWMGMKSLGLAEDQFDFQKESWEKNFAMMQDQYNRKLNNRRASRMIQGGQSQADIDSIANHYDSGAKNVGAYQGGGAPSTLPGYNTVGYTGDVGTSTNPAQGGGYSGSDFNNIISNPASAAIPVNTMNSAGMVAANTPYANQQPANAYIDNTNVDPKGEVVKSRRRVKSNGGAADSAVAGVSDGQGTQQPVQ
jgi:hypothetical protein